MNLVQQFPNITSSAILNLRNQTREKSKREERADLKNKLAKYYDNEFKKWHYKLVVIIVFTVSAVFGIAYIGLGLIK